MFAPHTSAGRLPTEIGLRFFVDSMLQVGDLSDEGKQAHRDAGRQPADRASKIFSRRPRAFCRPSPAAPAS